MPEAIFISPHLDDAVLSCGATIASLASRGWSVTVATVCTADLPDGEPLTPIARRLHASWSAGPKPFTVRRAEDERACAHLGARAVHLGLLDAMYRTTEDGAALYATPLAPIPAEDRASFLPQVTCVVRDVLATCSAGALVVGPAGTGGHPDHVLVRDAFETIVEPKSRVYFSDYPYSARSAPGLSEEQPHVVAVSPDALVARIEAVAEYSSQLRGLFPSAWDRWSEVASWRLAPLRPLLNRSPNLERLRARVAGAIEHSVELSGGEVFFWTGGGSPFA